MIIILKGANFSQNNINHPPEPPLQSGFNGYKSVNSSNVSPEYNNDMSIATVAVKISPGNNSWIYNGYQNVDITKPITFKLTTKLLEGGPIEYATPKMYIVPYSESGNYGDGGTVFNCDLDTSITSTVILTNYPAWQGTNINNAFTVLISFNGGDGTARKYELSEFLITQ